MTTPIEEETTNQYSILMTLIVVAILIAFQVFNVNATIPMVTAAAMLVFCIRRPVVTSLDRLVRLYEMRVPHHQAK